MLCEPNRTPYDLTFTLFRTPVRVHPLFWLLTAAMGPNPLRGGDAPIISAIWVGAVFVSILVHEMGHALAYRLYGGWGRVWLYWFGGVAVSDDARLWGWRQVVVSLAGPGAGFLLAGLVYASSFALDWGATPYLARMYLYLLVINIYWGIINLFPVWPLDGGQALHGTLEALRASRPMEVTLKVTAVTGALVSAWSLMNEFGEPRALLEQVPWWLRFGGLFTAALFGALAYSAYEQLRASRGWRDDGWR